MQVNGQLKNAQFEIINDKPDNADGCKGQMKFQSGADHENRLWVYDGTRWCMQSNLPLFYMGTTTFDNHTISTIALNKINYQSEIHEEGSAGATSAVQGEYTVPCDGFITVTVQGSLQFPGSGFGFNSSRAYSGEFRINGLPLTGGPNPRSDYNNSSANGASGGHVRLITHVETFEVSAGDVISYWMQSTTDIAQFKQINNPSMQGHYLRAYA